MSLPHAFTVVFNYADVAWELDLEGNNRTNSQITGTASAGGSGGANRKLLSATGATIFLGDDFGARHSVQWKSAPLWSDSVKLNELIGGEAFTVIMALKANAYLDPSVSDPFPGFPHEFSRLLGASNGHAYWTLSLKKGNLVGGVATANNIVTYVESTLPVGQKTVIAFRLSATRLGIKIGKNPWAITPNAGTVGNLDDVFYTVASGGRGLAPADADVERLSITKDALSDAEVDAAMQAVAAQDGITL